MGRNPPIDAARFEPARAEQRVAILASHYPEAYAIRSAVDVGHVQGAHFERPQASRGNVRNLANGTPLRKTIAILLISIDRNGTA